MTSAARKRFRPELRRGPGKCRPARHSRTIVRSIWRFLGLGQQERTTRGVGAAASRPTVTLATAALLIDGAAVERIRRIVVARCRRVPRRDERVDQRLVLRVERLADRGKIVGPLLEGA